MFLLVPAYPGSPGQKAIKRLCVCVCVCVCVRACVRACVATLTSQWNLEMTEADFYMKDALLFAKSVSRL